MEHRYVGMLLAVYLVQFDVFLHRLFILTWRLGALEALEALSGTEVLSH